MKGDPGAPRLDTLTLDSQLCLASKFSKMLLYFIFKCQEQIKYKGSKQVSPKGAFFFKKMSPESPMMF